MSAQLDLLVERARQRQARDTALDRLETTRADLIKVADKLAREIARRTGQVTSVDVFREMRGLGYQLDGYDPRWMGAVFRAGKGWQRVGLRADGSHSRPVSVWRSVA